MPTRSTSCGTRHRPRAGLLRPRGHLALVEYDADRGNPWVPFPISSRTWVGLAIGRWLRGHARAGASPEPLPGRHLLGHQPRLTTAVRPMTRPPPRERAAASRAKSPSRRLWASPAVGWVRRPRFSLAPPGGHASGPRWRRSMSGCVRTQRRRAAPHRRAADGATDEGADDAEDHSVPDQALRRSCSGH